MMEILLAILGGSALAAVINQVGNYIQARKLHQETTEDQENDDIAILKEAVRCILLDRIRYVGQSYIKEGEVDFDDRRILHQMHSIYHDGLKGNGDLDQIMNQVNNLKLKV